MKIIVIYRVVQAWRAPIFDKVSHLNGMELEVWHGPDFKGTKVLSAKKNFNFRTVKLLSFRIRLKSKNGLILMPFSPFLFFSLIFSNPKVIIAEGASNLINSTTAFVYSKIFRKRFIWWSLGKLQNRDYDKKRTKIDSVIQYIERNSDAIITYSSIGESYFIGLGIHSNKIFKAVNVVDTDAILLNLEKRKDRFELKYYKENYQFVNLFVGALIKEKSIDLLLYAQSEIEKKYQNCALLIIGDGFYRSDLERLSLELGLKNVEFLGQILDGSYKYFSIADLFTLPGLGGLAISEAMCYGLPVIASIGDGCEVDLVTDKNGIIDPDLTAERLFRHIEFFILNKEKGKLMGDNSLKVIKEKFNVSNYVNQIVNAIKA